MDEETSVALNPLPRCGECGGLARPNVLMFGDWGWIQNDFQDHNYATFLKGLAKQKAKPLVIEIGAGKAVPTVRYESERVHFLHLDG